jgi:hypothetical protein
LALNDPASSKNHVTLLHPVYDILYASGTEKMNSLVWLPEILTEWLNYTNIHSLVLPRSPKVNVDSLSDSCLVCKHFKNIEHVYITVRGESIEACSPLQHEILVKTVDFNRFEAAGTEEEQARELKKPRLRQWRKKLFGKRDWPYQMSCIHTTWADREDQEDPTRIPGKGTTIFTLLL